MKKKYWDAIFEVSEGGGGGGHKRGRQHLKNESKVGFNFLNSTPRAFSTTHGKSANCHSIHSCGSKV